MNRYQMLPKLDQLLQLPLLADAVLTYGRDAVKQVLNQLLEELREQIKEYEDSACKQTGDAQKTALKFDQQLQEKRDELPARALQRLQEEQLTRYQPVINATGILLHTNLGRAPLFSYSQDVFYQMMTGYSNLELDLASGRRGERYSHFSSLICRLTGAEDAIAVNNNAAAVLLLLSALCKNREVIVSRGELIEIGGKFRIPEVMEQGGAILREVGTTNKTHLSDYRRAINEQTGAILKVHTSNYRILGFHEEVSVRELVAMRQELQLALPILEDLGSGVLLDLSRYGLVHEPTVQEALSAGADLVCFSGDKLLGGPQAGIIAGKKQYIDLLRAHPLLRALRIDKATTALLSMTLQEYLTCPQTELIQKIPVLSMLTEPVSSVFDRGSQLLQLIQERLPADCGWRAELVRCSAQAGGGSLPLQELSDYAVTLQRTAAEPTLPDAPITQPPAGAVQARIAISSVTELSSRLRRLPLPIIASIHEERLYLHLRTLRPGEEVGLAKAVEGLLSGQTC